jgi:hypothetical protein
MSQQSNLLRWGTIALGAGLIAFSAPGIVAPRRFARALGIPAPDHPAADVGIHSVSVRDVVMGIGLISAAVHGGRLAPWLLARTLCDGGDAAAIAIAFARGGGNRRLGALGVVAAGAAAYDAVLWRLAKRSA